APNQPSDNMIRF
uniref:CalliMIRFamide-1 n=1 Tax=Calliphora vomitoria TaxID=27454 RepID=FARI_CALVO|nr:RecName: Full=CalliMIRFamide-1 [Calliphora vomitoria]